MTTPFLATDAYKLSMAQAGFPLREETFYFSFRAGGVHYVPWDLVAMVEALVDGIDVSPAGLEFARAAGYGPSDAMVEALRGGRRSLEIVAIPQGTWALEREPVLTVTGPSFLVSWLEPMLLWLNHPIQLATMLRSGREVPPEVFTATCQEHAELIERVMADVGTKPRPIVREDESYRERVRKAVQDLVHVVGEAERICEVGMRSAVCMGQHRIALEACLAEGVTRTSNLQVAAEFGMTPVGAMAHEHVQRWGSDLAAFEAMRDMRSAPPTYLLDTFDTMGSGIVAAVEVMRQRAHACSIRYDSGNKFIQYLHACEVLNEAGLEPSHVLEDGLDLAATRHFEALRGFTGWPRDKQTYGYGGSIVSEPMSNPLGRDRVSAVFKLSQTGGVPRMKFGDERGCGKQSVPGRPVLWRRLRGEGPLGMIGQHGEPVAEDYLLVSGNGEAPGRLRVCNLADPERAEAVDSARRRAVHSPATVALVQRVRCEIDATRAR